VDFQDKPSRNPFNPNILKGGQVDPGSKLYQRSVAGRQKLEDFVHDLWDQGKDEKDVFMIAVRSLTKRGHGYVGAYLDSKDPGRRYTEPQAMKIADEVMKKAGIGSHPGARLTPAKNDDEREARRGDRAQRREARKAGPKPAPAQKAKPVGQQRKEGKRTGSERVAEDDTRREGIGEAATGPVSGWQKTLEDRMEGKATTSDVLSAFQKQYQSKIKTAPKGGDKPAQPPASGGGQPPTGGAQPPDEETDTPGKPLADDVTVSSKFKELIEDNIKSNLPSTDKNALEGSIQEAIEILEDEYDVDPEAARAAIFRRFNNKLIGGRKVVFDPSSAPERPGQKESAPGPGKQEATGPAPAQEPPTAAPGQQEAAAPQAGSNAPKPEPSSAPAPQGGGEGVQKPAAAAPKKPAGGLNIPQQPARKGGGGFTPEAGKEAIDTIRQAVSEGKSVEEVVEQFKQGNLFPGGLVTDTAQTNPLEGGSTPASPGPGGASQTQEEKGGSLIDEQGQAKDFRKSGPQPTGGGGARQLPLPLGRENTAAKLKGRADVESRRLAKQEKSLGKPSPRPRKAGKSPVQPELFTKSGNPRKFNTSEMSSMSYDEFSQSVRSLLR